MGRPNRAVQTVLGVLVLKEMFDLTDIEALEELEFNLLWHHALGLEMEEAHLASGPHTSRSNRLIQGLDGHDVEGMRRTVGVPQTRPQHSQGPEYHPKAHDARRACICGPNERPLSLSNIPTHRSRVTSSDRTAPLAHIRSGCCCRSPMPLGSRGCPTLGEWSR